MAELSVKQVEAVAFVDESLRRALGEARSRSWHPSAVKHEIDRLLAAEGRLCIHGLGCPDWPYCPTTGADE